MSKHSRYQGVVNRQSDENISEDHWLKQFQKTLEKGAVQPRHQQSLFEQINSIMNTKSKYPSVEAAVDDMKERSGLTAYLTQVQAEVEAPAVKTKTAADVNDAMKKRVPMVIQKHPPIQKTLENCIHDSKGNLPIPAIIDRVRSIHQSDVSDAKDWDQDELAFLVSDLNLKAKQNNPDTYQDYNNLGSRDSASDSEIDPSNSDAFYALAPAKL